MNGIFTALLTPFNSDYTINEKSLEKLIKFNLDAGVHGFYVGGSTGEGMLMSKEERKRIFAIAKKISDGSVPLIAHVGAISTADACDMAAEAKRLGFDAISAVAPFYYSFPLEAIKSYYLDIVRFAGMPMFIYNFPAGNGFGLTPAIAKDIFSSDGHFAGIKHTSMDLFSLRQFKQDIDGITVFNGYDEICLAGLSMGADGAIGSTYNFMGEKFVKLYNAFREGNIALAQKLQNEACAIISEMCRYGVFQCEKEILTLMGIDMGPCRRPFLPLSEEGRRSMKNLCSSI